MTERRKLHPDRLAALEEERNFLLRSLADLDAELCAGDMDAADHGALADDYTRRAADVVRAIETEQAVIASSAKTPKSQIVVWLVGLALLGALSGVFIARSSGARTGNDGITGGVRESVVTQLNQARGMLADPERWDEAIDIFSSVIEQSPSNTEALTYRGWLRYRSGDDPGASFVDWDEVARLDPTYPDAIVFQTIALADQLDYEQAADVLARLDLETAPPQILELVNGRGLVGEIYGEANIARLTESDAPVSLNELGLTPNEALAAAGYLTTNPSTDGPLGAIKLYAAITDTDPANTAALSRYATILLQSNILPEKQRQLVDAAVESAPADPEALLTRALVVGLADPPDITTACDDLRVLLSQPDLPTSFSEDGANLQAELC